MADHQPSSRSCFVCGRDNPLGLKTRWVNDRAAGEVRCTVAIPEAFNGYPGVVHGGILSALLDEAMARTLLLDGGFDDLLVTGRLEVAYRATAPTGVPLTVTARLKRRSASRATAEAELRLPDGTVAANGKALLIRPPAEVAAAWEAERQFWKVD